MGIAKKKLEESDLIKLDRKKLESDMEFLGLVLFENSLKEDTKIVIE